MDVNCIMLSERSQAQKATYCMILFIDIWKRQTIREEEQISGDERWGCGSKADVRGEHEGISWGDGTVLNLYFSGLKICRIVVTPSIRD